MKKLFDNFFHKFFWHKGEIIGEGQVTVTEKKNHPEMILPGKWKIRKCNYCKEYFSKNGDFMGMGE